MKANRISIVCLILLLSSIPIVDAHVPFESDEGESLEMATVIPDPAKSWAIYSELHEGGEGQYYLLEMSQGDRLRVMLYLPVSESEDFTPNLVVMGPGITAKDEIPSYIEAPDEGGRMSISSERPERPAYEPFTPSSYYYIADVDLEILATGDYYLVIHEPDQGGRYGLAVGYREEYSLFEWIMVPVDIIGIRAWEGQSLGFVLAPMVMTLLAALGFLIWRRFAHQAGPRTLIGWTAAVAGVLYLGSGVTMLTQMVLALSEASLEPAVALTLVFALLPVLLGLAAIRLATGIRENGGMRTRIWLAVLGLLGLFSWAGLLLGPALALVASILPARTVRSQTSA